MAPFVWAWIRPCLRPTGRHFLGAVVVAVVVDVVDDLEWLEESWNVD